MEADVILLLQDSTDSECRFAPGIQAMFQKPMVGVVTKIDQCRNPAEVERAETFLKLAGVGSIVHISSVTGEGIEELRRHLE